MTGQQGEGGDQRRGITRRQLLAAGAASGVGVLAAGCGRGAASSTVTKATAVNPAGSDLGAVEHVIFLMMENRSYDHYYGTYPGGRGFDDHPADDLGVFSQACPSNTSASPVGRLLPFRLDTVNTDAADCTFDLTHNWQPQHLCRNGGKMDSFARVHTQPEYEGPSQGTLTMGYYTRADLPYYYALADAFTLCDGYHCSVMGPTHPNRLMQMSGTLDPAGVAGGPVIRTNGSPSALFSVHWDTMPEVLEDAGISWKYYNPGGALYSIDTMRKIGLTTDSVLPYFSQYEDPTSTLYQKAFLPTFPGDFAADVRAGTLPKVSWISTPVGYDEHPPAPSFLGEWFTDQVLQTLVSNPDVWSKTVLFHMYDENDGFFDHVDPPVAPPGTEGEYLSVRPLPSDAMGITGPIGLGFRVPMLVLSPFSRSGGICSQTFDHTSQLRFIEERFGVRAPNLSTWRRTTVGDLTATLRMDRSNATMPSLPPTRNDQAYLAAKGCTESDLLEIATDQPPYPVPAVQAMPAQEKRSVRA
ncbi:MAG: alkaline phosphatase family protein [Acidimicrobiales bacterium]|jgi:phospholipase C